MLIEAILAGFLTFGLPPAATPVKPCTNWSRRVGCATNHGGSGEASRIAKEKADRDAKGGDSRGRGNPRAK